MDISYNIQQLKEDGYTIIHDVYNNDEINEYIKEFNLWHTNIPELEENVEKLKLIPFMIVGSIPLVFVTWILSYFSCLIIFKSYRKKVKKNNTNGSFYKNTLCLSIHPTFYFIRHIVLIY